MPPVTAHSYPLRFLVAADVAGAFTEGVRTRRTSTLPTWSVLRAAHGLGAGRPLLKVGSHLVVLGQRLDGDVVVSGRRAQGTDGRLVLRHVRERFELVQLHR